MSSKSTSINRTDADKSREELLAELQELRSRDATWERYEARLLEKYRLFSEHTRDIVLFVNRDGRILEANEAAVRAYGYTRDELLSMTVYELRSTDPGHRVDNQMDTAFERGILFEAEHRRKDGTTFPVEVSSRGKIIDGNKVLLSVVRDITGRKQAEIALKESEEMFRVLSETSPAAIFLYQGDKLVYVNQAAVEFTGFAKEELKSKNFWDMVHPSSRELVKIYGYARQKGENVPSRYEVQYVTRRGEVRWAEFSVGRVEYRGKPAGIVVAAEITDRKRNEIALQDSRAQAELYLDLMGHDINNMHQVALGYLELAKDMPPGEGRAEYLDKSMEVLRRSTALIGNVRKLQRLREGVLSTGDVDLCRVLAAVQSEYAGVADRSVRLDLGGHVSCPVRANELLHDVFANLVNNAVKHTRAGTQIAIGLDRVTVEGRDYCRVRVEDDGPGIPDDVKDRIFNRMHKGSTRGMGLGLYLVKTLVDSYGGRVWMEDRVPGDHAKGARFVVLLPAIDG